MKKSLTILLLGFLAGILVAFLGSRYAVSRVKAEASAAHIRAEAKQDSLVLVADTWRDSAARADSSARQFAARRIVVYRTVIASPESAAAARGIPITTDPDGRRCLPQPDFAELMAAAESLPLCDSTLKATESRAGAAEASADLFRIAHSTAREDAALQAVRASLSEARERAARRRAWWFAGGGAVVGAAAVLLLGAR